MTVPEILADAAKQLERVDIVRLTRAQWGALAAALAAQDSGAATR